MNEQTNLFTPHMGPDQLREHIHSYLLALAGDYGHVAVRGAVAAALERIPGASPIAMDFGASEFELAWAVWPARGRKRSSKTASKAIWARVSHAVGSARLLMAVKAYAASEDATRSDGEYVPALDRWLKQGRHEGWLDQAPGPKRVGFV